MQTSAQNANGKQKNIYSCNFRSAGRLSNENARSLTSIHESFARHLSIALDAYLGTSLEVKLTALDQAPIKEHISSVPSLTYIVPFSSNNVASAMIVECDINTVFPMVDLLLGGIGGPNNNVRELSEIEEEIMQDVVTLIIRQAESAWHLPNLGLTAGRRIKSSVMQQYCPPNERLTCVKFELDISGNAGWFQLVFPMTFVNVLLQQIKQDQPQKRGSVRLFPRPSIRERILDCDIDVAAEVGGLRVAVKDLVALQPGSVLKLRAPVRSPGMLTAGGQPMFEAMPVRNGSQKAAQLGRRFGNTNWEGI
jgi:flagellar motor switch protein FliM